MSQSPQFLVVAPQGLGDALEATPIVRSLRAAYPHARIDVVVLRPGPLALFRGLPRYVDETIYLPFWERGALAFAMAVARNRCGRRYEAAFLAYPAADWKYHALLRAFPAARRFAHDHAQSGPGKRRNPIQLVGVRCVANVERNRDLLRVAGIAPDSDDGYLVPDTWRDSARPRAGITLHVGSVTHDGLAAKRWPLQSFIDLATRLVADGETVAIVVGADEREESFRLCAAVPDVTPFEGPLEAVARHLSSRRLVVANDNGMAHLAAGVGTPTIAIFGPTPVEFAPFAANALALRPSDCPACFDVRRPIVRCVRNIDFACLKAVTPELVHARARQVLAKDTSGTRAP